MLSTGPQAFRSNEAAPAYSGMPVRLVPEPATDRVDDYGRLLIEMHHSISGNLFGFDGCKLSLSDPLCNADPVLGQIESGQSG